MVTDIEDGIAELLANPLEQSVHAALLDRLEEDRPDLRRAALDLVLAHKASDGPRLVFALWCELHREPDRAEFIRVQCELARGPEGIDCDSITLLREGILGARSQVFFGDRIGVSRGHQVTFRLFDPARRCWMTTTGIVDNVDMAGSGEAYWASSLSQVTTEPWKPELAVRERELWSASRQWLQSLTWARLVDLVIDETTFSGNLGLIGLVRRGFISDITCTAAKFDQHGDAIVAEQPLERVTLTNWMGHPLTLDNGFPTRFPGILFQFADSQVVPWGTPATHVPLEALIAFARRAAELGAIIPQADLYTGAGNPPPTEPSDLHLQWDQTVTSLLQDAIQEEIVNPLIEANLPGQTPPQISFGLHGTHGAPSHPEGHVVWGEAEDAALAERMRRDREPKVVTDTPRADG